MALFKPNIVVLNHNVVVRANEAQEKHALNTTGICQIGAGNNVMDVIKLSNCLTL